ncbi:type II secretion system F family protein [Novosphingopyxis sp.]|uniref:type II secretion system F family protein n=1 Tax=Novosphingopyxis sp. TaxID=2709690 RepID=UPI003B5AA198
MSTQMMMFAATMVIMLGMVAMAFAGPSIGKATSRRLTAVKLRHSNSDEALLEKQMRKAVAAQRRPKGGKGSSRIDKLILRLQQTGKNITLQKYLLVCGALFAATFLLLMLRGAPAFLSLFLGVIAGLGAPHFVIGRMIKKRITKFTTNFPDALELLVRGLKSGLPIGETLTVVAKEIPGPVGEEFKLVTEKMRIGHTMEDALQDVASRLGTAEFQFFVITLAIQRETGGNLAETLGNLADVLRKRAQMKLKIRAMSSESKASAYIVGSLPFFVFGIVYWMNPGYLEGFFYEDRLIVAGIGGLIWMSIGAFIMGKMVSFEI